MKRTVLLVEDNEMLSSLVCNILQDKFKVVHKNNAERAEQFLQTEIPDAILLDLGLPGKSGAAFLVDLRETIAFSKVPVIVLSSNETSDARITCLGQGADDFLVKPFHPKELELRIEKLLTQNKEVKGESREFKESKSVNEFYSFRKRVFDMLLSGSALLVLLPLLVIVGIAIKLDSAGPVFFKSKRIGAGYKEFDLLKFRTMRQNADKEIKSMEHLNMYEPDSQINEEIGKKELLSDDGEIAEQTYLTQKHQAAAFKKFSNDPRITRLGRFLRNTSIDELPQLVNIFRGDMSLVGNRPLPQYEAEQLTKDEAAQRFLAPAGLTGLWQVTKRAQADMSADERIALDNTYAGDRNWKLDIKLIFRTFPALFQSENV